MVSQGRASVPGFESLPFTATNRVAPNPLAARTKTRLKSRINLFIELRPIPFGALHPVGRRHFVASLYFTSRKAGVNRCRKYMVGIAEGSMSSRQRVGVEAERADRSSEEVAR